MPVTGTRERAAVIRGTWLLAFVAVGCNGSSGIGRAGTGGCGSPCANGTTQCLSGSSLQTCAAMDNGCAVATISTCPTGFACERLAPAACVDPNWAEWPMPNCSADVATGAPNGQTYTAHGDGTVTDNVTGLMWQQTTPKTTYAWTDANAYCSTVTLGNFRDWRLPSAIELVSIVDYSVASPTPSIDIMAFPKTPADIFWSSTAVAGASSEAWYVNFSYGYAVSTDVSEINHVRCVR